MAPSEDRVRELVRRALAEEAGAEHPREPGHPPPAASQPAGTGGGAPLQEGEGRVAIALGSDHGGYALKERLEDHLKSKGHEVRDLGTHSSDSVDYPDYAHAVALAVASGECRFGVVVDGAGIGSAMAANKVPGIRAALCYDLSTARNSREHNHANVLTLGAGLVGEGLAKQILDEWLATDWGPGRHARRVEKIREIEDRYLRRGVEAPAR